MGGTGARGSRGRRLDCGSPGRQVGAEGVASLHWFESFQWALCYHGGLQLPGTRPRGDKGWGLCVRVAEEGLGVWTLAVWSGHELPAKPFLALRMG